MYSWYNFRRSGAFAIGILIPNLVGFIGGLPVRGAVKGPWYKSLKQPPFNPPGWVFPIVWTVMYTLMGVASVLVYRSGDSEQGSFGFNSVNQIPLALYGGQLLLNGLWPSIFFYFEQPFLALLELILLDIFIVATTMSFRSANTTAFFLMLPYVGWSFFATVLNCSVWLLNYDVSMPTNSTSSLLAI